MTGHAVVVLSEVWVLSAGKGVPSNHGGRAQETRPTDISWELSSEPCLALLLEGGGIRGRLNLDNLFRDFQGLFFPNSSNTSIPRYLHSSFSLVSTALEMGEGRGSGEFIRTRRIGQDKKKTKGSFQSSKNDLGSGRT